MGNSYKRHIAKTITWRIIASIDTVILSWLVTGSPLTSFKIGFVEVITKMTLYYLHERVWFKANLSKYKLATESKKRHILKATTWRLLGTIDTVLLAWIISGNMIIGLKIGFTEVITKMILYYFHERIWYKINFGLLTRKKDKV